MSQQSLNFLCVSRYFKGEEFMRSCQAKGNKVYLLTSSHLKTEAWPWESIEEVFYMDEDENKNWNMKHVIQGLAYKMRSIHFDRFVALDDFDVENTASLREHFRLSGMGDSTARFFRDKLAMRMKAEEVGIPIPAFSGLFNDADINHFAQDTAAPWLIKPRTAASARGIRKVKDIHSLWPALDELGDQRHHYLIEKFAPGTVYHVDSLSFGGKVLFTKCSEYLDTPLEVSQGGGIFRSQNLKTGSEDDLRLKELNEKVLTSFGIGYGASHTEFIKGKEDGKFYFLETASRVGGANLAEMVEAGSGINLWGEWAKIEDAVARGHSYELPEVKEENAGIVISLSRFQHPDSSSFNDDEVVWRIQKEWHIGMIVRSGSQTRVRELLDQYTHRIGEHFHASLPPMEEPRQ